MVSRNLMDEDRMECLERSLKELQFTAEDAERKYNEVGLNPNELLTLLQTACFVNFLTEHAGC